MSVSLIPESAPFNAEQRAWLNGFLAGWTGMPGGDGSAENGLSAVGGIGAVAGPAAEEEAEEFPWHDDSLPIGDRLELAEGKPLKRKLMAAMAQLDCGACGYVCKTYSEAIAVGEEKNLTLCSPGGKETAKTLKRLLKEEPAEHGAATNGAAKPADSGYSRSNPYAAKIVACGNLNGQGSSKQTTHAVIDLGGSGLTYDVGDSLGVYPTNCPDLADAVRAQLGLTSDPVLREKLVNELNLRDATDELLEVLCAATPDADEELAVGRLIDSDELDDLDVLEVLRLAPSAKLKAEEFAACLGEIAPRLYSIASSLKAHPGEVHLTVGKATTQIGDRLHKGVASTMFADRVSRGDSVKVFVQPSHGFSVPADPSAPMIMVGPGTGVAPFRAFLEERQATEAPGKNWLFFGDQHQATDFLYAEQFSTMQDAGVLTKLSLAFSRDQDEKIYVQDRMREHGAELWQWLSEGAYFFVCGDAKRMASDVDRALHEVIADHGAMTPDAAKAYVKEMKSTNRYSRDVY